MKFGLQKRCVTIQLSIDSTIRTRSRTTGKERQKQPVSHDTNTNRSNGTGNRNGKSSTPDQIQQPTTTTATPWYLLYNFKQIVVDGSSAGEEKNYDVDGNKLNQHAVAAEEEELIK